MQNLKTKMFVTRAEHTYGEGVYDYAQTRIESSRQDTTIVCPDHGAFTTKPNYFLTRAGCPKCRGIHARGYPPGASSSGRIVYMVSLNRDGSVVIVDETHPRDLKNEIAYVYTPSKSKANALIDAVRMLTPGKELDFFRLISNAKITLF